MIYYKFSYIATIYVMKREFYDNFRPAEGISAEPFQAGSCTGAGYPGVYTGKTRNGEIIIYVLLNR